MNKAKKISRELLDELNCCMDRFKNIDTENVYSKEFNEKLDLLFSAFCKALDARNDTHYEALGFSELFEAEIKAKLADLKISYTNSVSIGKTFTPDPETERILDDAYNLIDKICNKRFSNN